MKRILLTTAVICLSSISCVPQATPAAASKYTQLEDGEIQYLQHRGFGPQSFRTTQSYTNEDDEYELDNTQEGTQEREPSYSNYPAQRTTPAKNYPTPTPRTTYYASVTPKAYYQQQKQQPYRRAEQQLSSPNNRLEEELEKEEEEEEPDRLTVLLPQSKFQCQGVKTGYYADQGLGCEVFHYCHDNARHSWICPEGFTFHQIQLICMPPGGDNICEKSNDYHFVNEYLYKPVNLEEYQKKPYNTTLRYSDRYFPDSYRPKYEDDDYEDDRQQYRHSVRVTAQPAQQRYQAVASTTFRPQSPLAQVYRNSEEINISLQQRRPQAYQLQYERK